jgi:hypothetical protein
MRFIVAGPEYVAIRRAAVNEACHDPLRLCSIHDLAGKDADPARFSSARG